MEYTTLGRTGLKVSVAGLGCGGSSKLGLGTGKSEAEAVKVAQRAMDLGVNLIDTARIHGTEAVVGQAIKGRKRDELVVVTKSQPAKGGELLPVSAMIADLDTSLRTIGVDYVDVFMYHGCKPAHYDRLRTDYAEALLKERDKGKFRFLGCSPGNNPNENAQARLKVAESAAQEKVWDVMMIGMHMLNQQPREHVLKHTLKSNIGVLAIYAVRSIFSRPERLRKAIQDEVAAGHLPARMADDPEPLGFLMKEGGAKNIIDAAYRFIRHEPGCTVTEFGTGNIEHLETNIASILSPRLSESALRRLKDEFGHLVGVGMDVPEPRKTGAAA